MSGVYIRVFNLATESKLVGYIKNNMSTEARLWPTAAANDCGWQFVNLKAGRCVTCSTCNVLNRSTGMFIVSQAISTH